MDCGFEEAAGGVVRIWDTAVLFRTNRGQNLLEQMEYQIPFYHERTAAQSVPALISRNLAYLKMAAGDRMRKLFLEIMNRPNRYIARMP